MWIPLINVWWCRDHLYHGNPHNRNNCLYIETGCRGQTLFSMTALDMINSINPIDPWVDRWSIKLLMPAAGTIDGSTAPTQTQTHTHPRKNACKCHLIMSRHFCVDWCQGDVEAVFKKNIISLLCMQRKRACNVLLVCVGIFWYS